MFMMCGTIGKLKSEIGLSKLILIGTTIIFFAERKQVSENLETKITCFFLHHTSKFVNS